MSAVNCPIHDVNHWCGAGRAGDPHREWVRGSASECRAPHPDLAGVRCARLSGHGGECRGYLFSIITPEAWMAASA